MPTKTMAEAAFEKKLGRLLGEARRKPDPGPVMCVDEAAAERFRRKQEEPLPLDTEAVAALFEQYGKYLELIGEDEPVGSRRFFQFPPPRRAPGRPKGRPGRPAQGLL